MAKTKEAVSNAEDLVRAKRMILSREQTKNEINTLFNHAQAARKKDVETMDELLLQAPAAQTQSVNLQKESAAKNVEAFFEKRAYLTEAQKRYPELLKVGNTEAQSQLLPGKKPAGKIPTKAIISGGQ